jgi:Skp family chaperone for outer membrane proteins
MMASVALPMVYASLAALAVSAAFHFLVPSASRLAVVDVMKIMEAYDAPAVEAIKSGDIDAARKAAETRARHAALLDDVLGHLARERGVVLVQKQAVLSDGLPDLTDEVKATLDRVK